MFRYVEWFCGKRNFKKEGGMSLIPSSIIVEVTARLRFVCVLVLALP